MLIPGSLYGSHGDVNRRCAKAVRAIAKGARWTEAFMTDGVLDVAKTPGAVLLGGPSAQLPGKNFHVYLPPWLTQAAQVKGELPGEPEDEVLYADILMTAWGTLTLLAQGHTLITPPARYVNPTARERPTLEACVRYWPVWDALGPRFTLDISVPTRLAELPTSLRYLLIKLGIPRERLVDHVLDDFLELAAEVGA